MKLPLVYSVLFAFFNNALALRRGDLSEPMTEAGADAGAVSAQRGDAAGNRQLQSYYGGDHHYGYDRYRPDCCYYDYNRCPSSSKKSKSSYGYDLGKKSKSSYGYDNAGCYDCSRCYRPPPPPPPPPPRPYPTPGVVVPVVVVVQQPVYYPVYQDPCYYGGYYGGYGGYGGKKGYDYGCYGYYGGSGKKGYDYGYYNYGGSGKKGYNYYDYYNYGYNRGGFGFGGPLGGPLGGPFGGGRYNYNY